jgi:hypothetical protein
MFISCIERISYTGGILGCFKNESNNQKILLLICKDLNIGALDAYFYLFYRLQLSEHSCIAANLTRFLRSYFENMNSEILHQLAFLNETWMFSSGSESKIWNGGTSQSVKKRSPTQSTRYSIFDAGA